MSSTVRTNRLEWWDVQLTLKEKDRAGKPSVRYLLTNQGGELHQGQLLAIMGPSGCGKTSLLSVLAGRVAYNSKFTLTGNVQFNGESIHRAKLNKKIAVVAQDDTLFSFLTVRETLYLAAFFAGGEVVGKARTNLIVDAVMRELSLTAASETIVGSATRRGVSGGEYKRVLIGKELMKKPRTIFLDEPTSGLDSFQAFAVIESMKALATRNKIVVAVIHQPRSSIFGLFDLLLLLSAGKIMYFGPAAQAVQYFATMGYPCPEHFNPADFFLDLLSVNVKSAALEKESSHRIDALGRAWADPQNAAKPAPSTAPVEEPQPRRRTSTLEIINPEEARNYSGEVKDGEASDEGKDGEGDSDDECDEIIGSGKLDREAATGEIEAIPRESVFVSTRSDSGKSDPCRPVAKWFNAFGLLLWRALSEIFRNYGSLAIRAGTVLFYAMILSLIYQDLGYTQQNIQDRTGLLYFMLINQSFTPLFILLDVFPTEKVIVSREIISGAYPTSAYFTARVIAELPAQLVLTTVYSTIIYWAVGLNPLAVRYVVFLVAVLLTTFTSMALGFLVSAASPSKLIANAIGPPILIILLLFGGFYINTGSLPPGSTWVRYISMVYWGFQALVINEFAGETFTCDAPVPPQDADPGVTSTGCIRTGEQEIEMLSFQDGSVELALGLLAVLIVGFLIIAYIALLFNREKYQRIQPPPDAQGASQLDAEVHGKPGMRALSIGSDDEVKDGAGNGDSPVGASRAAVPYSANANFAVAWQAQAGGATPRALV